MFSRPVDQQTAAAAVVCWSTQCADTWNLSAIAHIEDQLHVKAAILQSRTVLIRQRVLCFSLSVSPGVSCPRDRRAGVGSNSFWSPCVEVLGHIAPTAPHGSLPDRGGRGEEPTCAYAVVARTVTVVTDQRQGGLYTTPLANVVVCRIIGRITLQFSDSEKSREK